MRTIAIFQTDLKVGGIQKSLINMLKSIDLEKYSIDLYLFDEEKFFDEPILNKINVIYLKPKNNISKFIPFSFFYKICKYKINKQYDISIDYNSYNPSCALAAINTNANKHIIWIHNDVVRERKEDIKYRILRFFFKSKYKYFNTFVGVSDGVIEPFKTLNKIKDSSFYVIPNIIDSSEIVKKSKENIDIIVDESKYNLISVGRLVIQKGFDILIDDIKQVIKKRKDIHLYIVGDGIKGRSLKKKVKKNKLEDYITFLGSKSNPYKYESRMDGFVIESRYEGQGIVILEAKILGLDLIIPDRLNKYLSDVPFTSNVIESIISLKKKNIKNIDMLDDYNNNIIQKLYNLFD